VYFNDVPVGTICCRLETKDGQTKLYLMTMGVLAVSTILPSMAAFNFELNATEALQGSTIRFPKLGAHF
jgi:hypothetical protein